MSQRRIKCQYCKGDAPLVDSSVVYGKSYGPIYYCAPCDAYVGVHKKTLQPLGTVANAELRFWRKQAHAAFDSLWQGKRLPRSRAYERLAKALGVSVVHIGESDIEQCKVIIGASEKLLKRINNSEIKFSSGAQVELTGQDDFNKIKGIE